MIIALEAGERTAHDRQNQGGRPIWLVEDGLVSCNAVLRGERVLSCLWVQVMSRKIAAGDSKSNALSALKGLRNRTQGHFNLRDSAWRQFNPSNAVHDRKGFSVRMNDREHRYDVDGWRRRADPQGHFDFTN